MCFQWLGLNHSSCRRKQVIIFVASFFFHFRQWEHFSRTRSSYHEQPHWGFRCNVLNTSEIYYKKLLLHNLKANKKCRLKAFIPANYVTQSTMLLSGKTWELSLLKNEVKGRWLFIAVGVSLRFEPDARMSHLGNHSNKKLSWTREIMWITASDMTQMCDYMPTSDS